MMPDKGDKAMGAMERVVLELPAELAAKLRSTAEGFASESELVETLLGLYEYQSRYEEEDLEAVRAAVAEGLADVEAGRVAPEEEVYERVLARIDDIAAKKSK
jgi:predicted transcriptional regulator